MEINRSICPICGKPNNCAYENGLSHGSCWCEKVKVPRVNGANTRKFTRKSLYLQRMYNEL